MTRLIDPVDKLGTENARLQDERAELFGRLGFYQAELEHARQTIKALQAPKEPEPPRRPWWRFWG